MSTSAEIDLQSCIEQAYLSAYSCHGELDYASEGFADNLISIIEKNLGEGATQAARFKFLAALHTTDIYLAGACALPSEVAWVRFIATYQKYVNDLVAFFFGASSCAKELAASVLTDMFLPDSSGRSRIASYDGRSSLATWLRAIVNRRTINERERKWNSVERLDSQTEVADLTGIELAEATLRASRYGGMVRHCFKCACEKLTERERLMLLWRYDEQLQVSQIAHIFAVNPSTVSRQLEQTYRKLREDVVLMLASKYKLGAAAIEECLTEILESPYYSLLLALKAG